MVIKSMNDISPRKLLDSINYQEKSVVSTTLIDKGAGTVTLFAFDIDQGLSEHAAPYDALIVLLEGTIDITVNKKLNTVSAGELLHIPQGSLHALKATKKAKMLLTMIRE